MRLINAEKLIKDVEKDFCYPEAYKKMIEAQPTAYDLDKVLEDLEEYAYSDGLCFCNRNRGCPYKDNEKIGCKNCAAIGALEIVKGGGYQV